MDHLASAHFRSRILLCVGALVLVGCAPTDQNAAVQSNQPVRVVAVLGDESRVSFVKAIASEMKTNVEKNGGLLSTEISIGDKSICLKVSADNSIATQASLVKDADAILIVDDATQGPLPITREHVVLAHQSEAPVLAFVFTNSERVDDPELLELEEIEMRELLSAYGHEGDKLTCCFDSRTSKTTNNQHALKGGKQMVEKLSFPTAKPPARPKIATKRCLADVYALSKEEAFVKSVGVGIKSGSVNMVIGGKELECTVSAERFIQPGEPATKLSLSFDPALNVAQGQKFIFVTAGHISAVGFIESIIESQ